MRRRRIATAVDYDLRVTLEPFYGDWRLYHSLFVDALRGMSAEELALRAPSRAGAAGEPSSTSWPIWAIAGHTAGTRVYWLCEVMGVPGAEATPFQLGTDVGWEDDLDHPRTATELVAGWETTWAVVERALEMWTPADLDVQVATGDGARHLTRRSLVLRMITHEAYHAGEVALIQGIHGRTPIDLWPPGYHTVEATAARAGR